MTHDAGQEALAWAQAELWAHVQRWHAGKLARGCVECVFWGSVALVLQDLLADKPLLPVAPWLWDHEAWGD
jgi:hypothetical protein